jgi:hypothetical protein
VRGILNVPPTVGVPVIFFVTSEYVRPVGSFEASRDIVGVVEVAIVDVAVNEYVKDVFIIAVARSADVI